jgi:hypothetical protein
MDPVFKNEQVISVLRWMSPANEYSSFRQTYLSRYLSIPSREDGKRSSFQNFMIFFLIQGDWQSPETQQ